MELHHLVRVQRDAELHAVHPLLDCEAAGETGVGSEEASCCLEQTVLLPVAHRLEVVHPRLTYLHLALAAGRTVTERVHRVLQLGDVEVSAAAMGRYLDFCTFYCGQH